jgi:adenylyltransferase/sulfurtransferase
MELSDEQVERYARHIILRDVGGAGQQKLLNAHVLVIGAGGLGSPVLLYLAAAGVGTIGLIDDDVVSLSNLQRQVVHDTENVGKAKVESARDRIRHINPDVKLITYDRRLDAGNALDLFAGYDVIADGTDNFATRYLVNDAAFFAKKPLVSAAIGQFDGQLSTFRGFEANQPCYRCLYPEAPPEGTIPSCAEAGVLGALAGVMGSLQALEIIREVVGFGTGMAGRLLIFDGLGGRFRDVRLRPDPDCALCGAQATYHDLGHHAKNE